LIIGEIMKKLWAVVLLSALPLLLLACAGPYGEAQGELSQNEQKWAAQNIDDYRYTLRILCFCPEDIRDPVVVEVRDGATQSVTYAADGRPATNNLFESANTVDELFDIIRGSIARKVDKITVEYDPALGYPKQISIDPNENMVDEETAYTVSELTPLR
jgi:hypothetical protein